MSVMQALFNLTDLVLSLILKEATYTVPSGSETRIILNYMRTKR